MLTESISAEKLRSIILISHDIRCGILNGLGPVERAIALRELGLNYTLEERYKFNLFNLIFRTGKDMIERIESWKTDFIVGTSDITNKSYELLREGKPLLNPIPIGIWIAVPGMYRSYCNGLIQEFVRDELSAVVRPYVRLSHPGATIYSGKEHPLVHLSVFGYPRSLAESREKALLRSLKIRLISKDIFLEQEKMGVITSGGLYFAK